MELKDRRLLTFEEECAIEDEFPAVCGPSPLAYATRYGLKLSKRYLEHLRKRNAAANGHSSPRRRRKTVA